MNPARAETTVRRLSRYARCLRRAIHAGTYIVTSDYLASTCGTSAASVRKDLSMHGGLGKQGSGYDATKLLKALEDILGVTQPPPLVLLGAGKLGRALLESGIPGTRYSFEAAFDIDGRRTGSRAGDVEVRPVAEMTDSLSGTGSFIGVIAVTPGRAQEAADALAGCGCRAILSFNMEPISVKEPVSLRYADTPTELDLLSHALVAGRNRRRR
jgi:redox-sensing transcriptional repressor